MDTVSGYIQDLTAENEVARLRAIMGLVGHPNDDNAVAEVIETLKSDLLGELSIVAAVALAAMERSNPRVATAVARRYRESIGSAPIYGGYDPTLRLSYFFAVAGSVDWFRDMQLSDLIIRNDSYREQVTRYVDAAGSSDVRITARLMVWLESLDTYGDRHVFEAARRALPGWDHWFKPLIKATHR